MVKKINRLSDKYSLASIKYRVCLADCEESAILQWILCQVWISEGKWRQMVPSIRFTSFKVMNRIFVGTEIRTLFFVFFRKFRTVCPWANDRAAKLSGRILDGWLWFGLAESSEVRHCSGTIDQHGIFRTLGPIQRQANRKVTCPWSFASWSNDLFGKLMLMLKPCKNQDALLVTST